MIGDKTVAEFLFQWLVMVQPIIWIILYNQDIKINYQTERGLKYLFIVVMEGIFLAIVGKKISVGFYTTTILAQYIFLIVVSFYLYTQRNPLTKSISLAFLTVFLNSLYWELPLHIVELFTVGFYTGQLIQYWRLLPALWLTTKFSFTRPQKRWILAGTFFSWFMMILRSEIPLVWPRTVLMFINRTVCLVLLTMIITDAEPKQLNNLSTNN